jgi:hypothetical protein
MLSNIIKCHHHHGRGPVALAPCKTILPMCPLGISIASLMFLVGANGEGMLYGTLPWREAVKGQ